MPTDAALPFAYGSGGDIETVSGDAFYHQHAQHLALIAAEEQAGESLTANDIIAFETDLIDIFAASPVFDTPISIEVLDSGTETLKLAVDVDNVEQFEVEI